VKSKKPKDQGEKQKKRPGRPEKHTKEEILGWESEYLASCGQGMSDRVFLGKKGLHRTYFDERIHRDIPELTVIKEKGHAIREEFYTKIGIAGMTGRLKGFNLGAYVWTTKHMLGWWDVIPADIDLSLGGGRSSATITYKSRFAGESEKE
jgi:hypothetical protein